MQEETTFTVLPNIASLLDKYGQEAAYALSSNPLSESQENTLLAMLNSVVAVSATLVGEEWFSDESGTIYFGCINEELTTGDFTIMVEAASRYHLTKDQIQLLKEVLYVPLTMFPLKRDDSESNNNKYILNISKENIESTLEIISKHNFNVDLIEKLETAECHFKFGTSSEALLNGLDKTLSNLEKYDWPTQPWSAWVGECLGYTYEPKPLVSDMPEGAQ